ncbi:MAG: metal-dependent hydrolase, partial [Janthinobacterium lividum]
GLAAGELLHRCLPAELDHAAHAMRHRLLLVSCALASNFPDLDLITTGLLPAPLGYLLNHRGHTHTLLYAIPQALLLCALLWLLWPSARGLLRASKPARLGLALSVTIGFVLHLAMDLLNSYGLHPLYPFDARWLYGDTIFILEPMFWIGFGVPLAMMVRRPAVRTALLALLLFVPVFFTVKGFLSWYSLVWLLALSAGLAALQYKVRQASGTRALAGLLAAFVTLGSFIAIQTGASHAARLAVQRASLASDPGSQFLDAAMSAFPSNPACWSFVSVAKNERAGSYRLQRGILSLLPSLMPVAACPAALIDDAAQKPLTRDSAAIVLQATQQGSLARLRRLDQENCHFAAWMRFARMPVLEPDQASDARFDNGLRQNFSTLRFEDFKERLCSPHIAQWGKPRLDLLDPAAP